MRHASALSLLLSCKVPSPHQHTSLTSSFISCFGSTSCSMPPYSNSSAITSLSPPLSACSLITTETRIPTYPLHTDTTHFTYCNTHFSSWDILLPSPQVALSMLFLPSSKRCLFSHSKEGKGSYCTEQIEQHIKYQSGESAWCRSEDPGQHQHHVIAITSGLGIWFIKRIFISP